MYIRAMQGCSYDILIQVGKDSHNHGGDASAAEDEQGGVIRRQEGRDEICIDKRAGEKDLYTRGLYILYFRSLFPK